jgi:hypothetical protein
MAKQPKSTSRPSPAPRSSVDDIRTLAYQLYCENGRQNGHDLEYWLEAERRLRGGGKTGQRKAA